MAKVSTRGAPPQKAAKAAPGVNGYKYREQYGVVIVCKEAAQQEQLYGRLKAEGLKVKVVCV